MILGLASFFINESKGADFFQETLFDFIELEGVDRVCLSKAAPLPRIARDNICFNLNKRILLKVCNEKVGGWKCSNDFEITEVIFEEMKKKKKK